MTKEERQSAILDQLLKQGSVLVSALSDNLQVSAVTIRKDLTDLERQGRLYRSHGKAILINPFTANRSVKRRKSSFQRRNIILARQRPSLSCPTTPLSSRLARRLPPLHNAFSTVPGSRRSRRPSRFLRPWQPIRR